MPHTGENNRTAIKKTVQTADHTSPDKNADKTGTDANSDSTEKRNKAAKFDKPTRETDPDTTGVDIDADKTKKRRSKNLNNH